ncbi:oxidoreductase [Gordonia humi]|uniref:NAD(P)-dependent dehydrogenase (Short-subunit alcohol dehydrogenase family) n=1 Tax=Gordonia humi TaxID=686429 RepID=A0A840F1L8_9ACTN|nr:oxidoreductase [Gordonia humi]MBB4134230.1 NAD(P)-dependent dehydrogenase (short-subunit alcohol dehydrogenase family) [Gordonia humi]
MSSDAMAWTSSDLPSFSGRTVVVTGSNSGLGLVAATHFARVGAKVVLAVRNTAKGERAATSIAGDTEVRRLDLADLDSVRTFADGWSGDIDVLVNNAGLMHVPEGRTADGFETQIGTNHLGHFALTNLLLPHVTDRIVTMSSMMHRAGRISLDDLNWERRTYNRVAAYGQSKLANLMFSLELQRRLTASGSTVRSLAAHPGYASTNLQTRTNNAVLDWGGRIGNKVIAQSAEAGTWPMLFAASQDLPGGSYVGPDAFNEVRGHPALAGRTARASDLGMCEKLWDLSAELTAVGFGG